jgi:hypothetical protein
VTPWIHEIAAALELAAGALALWAHFRRALKDTLRELIQKELAPHTDKVLKLEGRMQRLEHKRGVVP